MIAIGRIVAVILIASTELGPSVALAHADAAGNPKVKSGYADVRCVVTSSGTLTNCRVLDESPGGLGFGAAALKLTTIFKMKAASGGRLSAGQVWTQRIRFALDRKPQVELGPGGPTIDPVPAEPLSR